MADAIGAGGCGVGVYGIDGFEDDSRPRVDIITSIYTG